MLAFGSNLVPLLACHAPASGRTGPKASRGWGSCPVSCSAGCLADVRSGLAGGGGSVEAEDDVGTGADANVDGEASVLVLPVRIGDRHHF